MVDTLLAGRWKAGKTQLMPIWKITPEGPIRVSETKLTQEKLLEEKLEDWITTNPTLLGEPLLVIGRQVIIPDAKIGWTYLHSTHKGTRW
jgi:hypothetical protein